LLDLACVKTAVRGFVGSVEADVQELRKFMNHWTRQKNLQYHCGTILFASNAKINVFPKFRQFVIFV